MRAVMIIYSGRVAIRFSGRVAIRFSSFIFANNAETMTKMVENMRQMSCVISLIIH